MLLLEGSLLSATAATATATALSLLLLLLAGHGGGRILQSWESLASRELVVSNDITRCVQSGYLSNFVRR